MKAWLKGGLIGGIIGGLYTPLSNYIDFPRQLDMLIMSIYPLTKLICKTGGDFSAPISFCIVLVYALYFFILGSIIGWIIGWVYGKIKSKKQQPVQTQPQVQIK